MKILSPILAVCASFYLAAPVHAAAHTGAPMAGDKVTCEKAADDKKLAGAARTSNIKKCMADAKPAASAECTKSADDKKLAGAARTSHIKKCTADAMPAKPAAAAGSGPKK